MSNDNYVFCYGSLKQGFHNHDIIALDFDTHSKNKGYDFLGEATTVDKFTMYDIGSFPAITFDEDGKPVSGELYAVDQTTFELLDVLEGFPHHYNRVEVELSVGVKAWIYYYETPDEDDQVFKGSDDDVFNWEQ